MPQPLQPPDPQGLERPPQSIPVVPLADSSGTAVQGPSTSEIKGPNKPITSPVNVTSIRVNDDSPDGAIVARVTPEDVQQQKDSSVAELDAFGDDFGGTQDASEDSSFLGWLIHTLFFLPNTVLLKPVSYLFFVLTYPFKLIIYLLFYRVKLDDSISVGLPQANTETHSLGGPIKIGNTPDLSPPAGEDATGSPEDIEVDVPEKFDDAIKSPTGAAPMVMRQPGRSRQQLTTGTKPSARTTQNTPRSSSHRKRLIFPRLLFNFDISNPPNLPKKTLVLDLDETLIHSLSRRNSSILSKSKGAIVEVKLNNVGLTTLYYIYKRPHVDEFLSIVRHWFNLVVFTASIREYADPVIDYLEEEVRLRDKTDTTTDTPAPKSILDQSKPTPVFSQRFYRDSCIFIEGKGYVKDLSVLTGPSRSKRSPTLTPSMNSTPSPSPSPSNSPALSPVMLDGDSEREREREREHERERGRGTARSRSQSHSRRRSQNATVDLSKMIIIDNSPISYANHRDNGIMIEGWINDPDDVELMTLLPLLNSLRFTSDVRMVLGLKNGQSQFK